MKTSTMKTCMMTGKMCMCKSMDMCFGMKKRKAASDASVLFCKIKNRSTRNHHADGSFFVE